MAANADSLTAWGVRRDSLGAAQVVLRADYALLAQRYAAVRRFVPSAQDSIRRLLALLPDSTREPLGAAVAVVQEALTVCEALAGNCEQRAANAEARAIGDSTALARIRILLDSTEVLWRAAEQKARPSFFRDLWRSRGVTFPLLGAVLILSLKR